MKKYNWRLDWEQINSLYQKGLSCGDIATFVGASRQAVWGIMKSHNCKLRGQLKFGEENNFYRNGRLASDKSHNLLEQAIKKQIIIPKNKCNSCGKKQIFKNGRSGIEAHHCDYNKPLEIRWLCKKCHFEWHKKNKAKKYDK